MVTACIVVIELALLEAKLLGFEGLALTLFQAIENLAILRCAKENRTCALDGLLACSNMVVCARNLTREEIQMAVCESQALCIELAMLGDELASKIFAPSAEHLAARLGVGENALFARKEQLLLLFDALALSQNGREPKNEARHSLRDRIEAPQRLLIPGRLADALTQKMTD